ncbi:uncharacterized protein LOC128167685 [Crassostrea angulata]|uniref:uncharacterized protein LOC128167685 n=1 Tax=Magallana angulata TaxID=2784310 RepID=UPI0022B1AC99|nr:uncharacterized protein LOC128167685 [Crassostrea angulata]
MENFNRTVRNFVGILKVILWSFNKTVGSSDTINKKQLLFQDLVDLSQYFQESKEDCLSRLHRTITMCTDNLQVAEEEMLEKKMKEEEKIDLLNFVTVTTNIIQGIMSNPNDKYLKSLMKRMKDHWGALSYHGKEINVEEISKTNLWKMIKRYTSHEEVDEKPGLRRLLQACIDFLQTQPGEFWKNASITIYDEDDKLYKIASGTRKHQFICRMKNGEPFISETTSVSEHKEAKPDQKPSTETTRNPSQKMEIFEQTVMNFCRTLEACSAEQRIVANEVLKSLNTFVEEILLAFHITVGSSDTINVKELLFQDLVNLSRYLKPEQYKNVISYLAKLQEAKNDRLSSLHRTIAICGSNLQVAEKEVLQKKMKEEEKSDLVDFLTMTTLLIQGIMTSNLKDGYLRSLVERMKEHRGTFSFKDKEMDVEEINKRHLGKMIIRYIGHEGVAEKPGLRRLLQACIDFLQTQPGDFWKNASITIYDEDDKLYKIASGTRKHQFICRMKNGEPFIKEKKSISEHKEAKPNHKPSTETTHDPSQKGHDHSCLVS